MTLSLNNSNKDFDFVGWVIKTSWLIYFRSLKFHYVKETHMMLVALKIVVASQHKRQREILCQALLRNENTRTRTWKPSSETQGLLAGTMRYFRAKVYFRCWRAPGNLFLPNQFQKWSNSVPLIGQKKNIFLPNQRGALAG